MIEQITLEELDRAIYNRIRLAVVGMGWLPDKFAYANNGAGYTAAKAAFGSSLIEVFGVGSTLGRDDLKASRITVNRRSILEGQLGGYPAVGFVEYTAPSTKKRFTKSYLPELQNDVVYDIRLISSVDSTVNQRRLIKLVMDALGLRRYISTYDNTGAETGTMFLVYHNQSLDVTSTPDFKEHLMSYVAADIWLSDGAIIGDRAAIEEITFTHTEKEDDTTGVDNVIVP